VTARQHYTLSYDAESCGARFSCMSRRADVTRAAARVDHGWTHGLTPQPNFGGPHRSVDYCAEHASLAADLTPKALPIHARPVADVAALVETSSVGEGLRRIARDGADAEASRAADELTSEVMAQVVEANQPTFDVEQRPVNVRHVAVTPRGLELGGFRSVKDHAAKAADAKASDDWHDLWDGDPKVPRDR